MMSHIIPLEDIYYPVCLGRPNKVVFSAAPTPVSYFLQRRAFSFVCLVVQGISYPQCDYRQQKVSRQELHLGVGVIALEEFTAIYVCVITVLLYETLH